MITGEVLQQQLTYADYEARIDALKWIAALGRDPIERIAAYRKVFELRGEQFELERAL